MPSDTSDWVQKKSKFFKLSALIILENSKNQNLNRCIIENINWELACLARSSFKRFNLKTRSLLHHTYIDQENDVEKQSLVKNRY